MRVVTDFPFPVRNIEHTAIPMRDGKCLAARIWLPESAEGSPVPALLEYIPYRKRDGTRLRDSRMHQYLAGYGYACIRVDLRGSGDSEGVMRDQYRQEEMDDGLDVLRWISRQDWCDGAVGMLGLSWGGFNSLQIAALRPSEMRAVVTVCSTDDLYLDNMHYMGGCLLTDNLSEATTMFSINTCPPDPEIVGDRWRDMWLERLESNEPWLETWLSHQRRDAYWEHGSISEDYASVCCPVMAVGGWADGYTNAVFRLLQHLEVPRLGLIGPWGHKYPHEGQPGPAIGFLQEMRRWWDHWLKGVDTGIMEEPMLRAWMQDSVPPTTWYRHRPGRWVGERSWPSPRIGCRQMRLVRHRLVDGPPEADGPDEILSIRSPLSVGLFAGKWCSYTAAPDLPHDQREEDGGALVFESDPLTEDLEILGAPEACLLLAASEETAMVAVRLSDVDPQDRATRVTYGILNLTHRQGHAAPRKMQPGQFISIRVPLNHIAQVFPRGHRLRLSLSTSYWPLAWPPPRPVRLLIKTSKSVLELPERSSDPMDAGIHFAEPESAAAPPNSVVEPAHHNWLVHRDLAEDISTLEVIKDEGVLGIDEIDLEMGDRTWDWYTYQADDFCSLTGETRTERSFRRGDWFVRTRTRTVLTADISNFHIYAELDAFEGDRRVFSRTWRSSIPRDGI